MFWIENLRLGGSLQGRLSRVNDFLSKYILSNEVTLNTIGRREGLGSCRLAQTSLMAVAGGVAEFSV
jgi:hypothetical protein